MADKEEAAPAAEKEAEAPAPKKKSKMGLVIALVLPLVAAGGTYFAMAQKSDKPAAPPKPEVGPILSLESFIVNLNEPGANRYFKVTLDLELNPKAKEEEVKGMLPRFRDAVLVYLTGLKEADVQKPEAKVAMKKKVMEFANSSLGRGTIKAVYYKELVIQ